MLEKETATAAAKSLQSCPTLCDPIDSSPPGSPVPGILQARVLEWGAIAFSSQPRQTELISDMPGACRGTGDAAEGHILTLVLWVLGSESGCESAFCWRPKHGRQALKGSALRPQRRLLGGEEVTCEWGPGAEYSHHGKGRDS